MPGGTIRRTVLTLGGTAAGLAALLSFKTHSPASAAPDASTAGTAGTQAATAPATTAPVTAAPATKAASKAATTKSSATASAGAGGSTETRSFTGAVESTPYGPMQVKVTLTGQRITAVTVLQETNDGAESQQIDSFSIPKLTSETLTAQSARIDSVSGATSTSTGYIGSLQSALDQA